MLKPMEGKQREGIEKEAKRTGGVSNGRNIQRERKPTEEKPTGKKTWCTRQELNLEPADP